MVLTGSWLQAFFCMKKIPYTQSKHALFFSLCFCKDFPADGDRLS